MIVFSRSSQPPDVSSSAKHCSTTWIAMDAAIDASGEAPSRATIEWLDRAGGLRGRSHGVVATAWFGPQAGAATRQDAVREEFWARR